MNTEHLNQLARSPESITTQDARELEELTRNFPYFALPWALLTRFYSDQEDYRYEETLHKSAIRIHNRNWLYELLHPMAAIPEVETTEISYDPESETVTSDAITAEEQITEVSLPVDDSITEADSETETDVHEFRGQEPDVLLNIQRLFEIDLQPLPETSDSTEPEESVYEEIDGFHQENPEESEEKPVAESEALLPELPASLLMPFDESEAEWTETEESTSISEYSDTLPDTESAEENPAVPVETVIPMVQVTETEVVADVATLGDTAVDDVTVDDVIVDDSHFDDASDDDAVLEEIQPFHVAPVVYSAPESDWNEEVLLEKEQEPTETEPASESEEAVQPEPETGKEETETSPVTEPLKPRLAAAVYNIEDYYPAEPEVSDPTDFFSWLNNPGFHEQDKPESEEANPEPDEDLIARFIRTNPKVSKPKSDFFDAKDIAVKSDELREDIATETLANVYLFQKNPQKAIQIYERLILKSPEKKTYFAGLIEKTKKDFNL